jgi:hypothetical protein
MEKQSKIIMNLAEANPTTMHKTSCRLSQREVKRRGGRGSVAAFSDEYECFNVLMSNPHKHICFPSTALGNISSYMQSNSVGPGGVFLC